MLDICRIKRFQRLMETNEGSGNCIQKVKVIINFVVVIILGFVSYELSVRNGCPLTALWKLTKSEGLYEIIGEVLLSKGVVQICTKVCVFSLGARYHMGLIS